MPIENLPLFNAMNKEEVHPVFPNPKRPLTAQESHFAIMEKVRACISEVNRFEQAIRQELENYFDKTNTENYAFKEALQESYNTFLSTIQKKVNDFETDMSQNYQLHLNDFDTRIADFQTAINNEFETLQGNFLTASNSKIKELTALQTTLVNNYNSFVANVQEIVDTHKTQVSNMLSEQDNKIEAYKQHMVDNLLHNVREVFGEKAESGEITNVMKEVYGSTRTFKGSKTYNEITAITNASNGDYYFCTTNNHFYQNANGSWIDIGNGETLGDDYQTYKVNNDVKMNKLMNQPTLYSENLLPLSELTLDYDGNTTYKTMYSPMFYLDKGIYRLVVPETNFVSVMIVDAENQARRLVSFSNEIPKTIEFEVGEGFANIPLYLFMNASLSTPTEARFCHAKFYLIKIEDGKTIYDHLAMAHNLLTNELITNNNPIVKEFAKINHYHGAGAYVQYVTQPFTLSEGDYRLAIVNNTYLGVTVGTVENFERIVDTRDLGDSAIIDFTIASDYANVPIWITLNHSYSVEMPAQYRTCKMVLYKNTGKPFIPDFLSRHSEAIAYCDKKFNEVKFTPQIRDGKLSVDIGTLSANTSAQIPDEVDVKKNKVLVFSGKVDNFNALILGHGKTSYGGSYAVIKSDRIETYHYTTSAYKGTEIAHNLDITGFITAIIKVGIATATITIVTEKGSFTTGNIEWGGDNGKIFVEADGCTFTNCKMSWTCADLNKPVWVFGDSYFGLTNNARIGKHLIDLGFDNWLVSGFPGANSYSQLESLKTLIKLGKPQYIVWCLGMNDGDGSGVNASWLNCLTELEEICENNNITLITTTIPTTPNVNNVHKTEYIKSLGYRYIDFADAVTVNNTWREGMLSADNVHPTESGARTLAMRIALDFPEITW